MIDVSNAYSLGKETEAGHPPLHIAKARSSILKVEVEDISKLDSNNDFNETEPSDSFDSKRLIGLISI